MGPSAIARTRSKHPMLKTSRCPAGEWNSRSSDSAKLTQFGRGTVALLSGAESSRKPARAMRLSSEPSASNERCPEVSREAAAWLGQCHGSCGAGTHSTQHMITSDHILHLLTSAWDVLRLRPLYEPSTRLPLCLSFRRAARRTGLLSELRNPRLRRLSMLIASSSRPLSRMLARTGRSATVKGSASVAHGGRRLMPRSTAEEFEGQWSKNAERIVLFWKFDSGRSQGFALGASRRAEVA